MEVEFNESQPISYNYPPKNGAITNLVIKMGLAKDEKSANIVMIVFIIVCFIASIYLLM
ncbi:MAG: hypothetical protein WCP24_02235 [bacterium]